MKIASTPFMTTISSLATYLNNSSSQTNSKSSTLTTTTTQKSGLTGSSQPSAHPSTSDETTLSAAAQALLEKLNKKNYGFTLTDKQQEQIKNIVAKYKDEPVTQATLDKIQKDLKKVRLDTATLAAKDSAKLFSLKGLMSSILNGSNTSQTVSNNQKTVAANKAQYIKQLTADLKALSAD